VVDVAGHQAARLEGLTFAETTAIARSRGRWWPPPQCRSALNKELEVSREWRSNAEMTEQRKQGPFQT
jgi:hypothetical protein